MNQDDLIKDFAFNLKMMLTLKNISQGKLAKMSGIDRGTVSRYCNGDIMPSLKNAVNIASALGCKLDDLVTIEEYID